MIVYIKIWILAYFKIQKLLSSLIKLPGKFAPLGYMQHSGYLHYKFILNASIVVPLKSQIHENSIGHK